MSEKPHNYGSFQNFRPYLMAFKELTEKVSPEFELRSKFSHFREKLRKWSEFASQKIIWRSLAFASQFFSKKNSLSLRFRNRFFPRIWIPDSIRKKSSGFATEKQKYLAVANYAGLQKLRTEFTYKTLNCERKFKQCLLEFPYNSSSL